MFSTPSRSPSTLEKAEADGLAFMRKVGAKSLAELRGAPAENHSGGGAGLGYRPIVDGRFLPKSPAEIFAAAEQSDVPLMAGWNKDEGVQFHAAAVRPATESGYLTLCAKSLPTMRRLRSVFLPGGSPRLDETSARALGGDLTIIHSTWAWIEAHKTTEARRSSASCSIGAPLTPDGWFGKRDNRTAGAFHAGEILYVFDNLDAFPWLVTDKDRALAKLASSHWLNFVKKVTPTARRPADLALVPLRRRDAGGSRCRPELRRRRAR